MNQFPIAVAAPPLTDDLISKYKALGAAASPEVKDAFEKLLACVEKWWNLPDSSKKAVAKANIRVKGVEHELGVVPLEDEHVKELWDCTPWMRETFYLASPEPGTEKGLFHELPPGELKNAAFHLLWYVREITLDREPMSQDKLVKK